MICIIVLSMARILRVPNELACYLIHRQYFHILFHWDSDVESCNHPMKLYVDNCIICVIIMEYQS